MEVVLCKKCKEPTTQGDGICVRCAAPEAVRDLLRDSDLQHPADTKSQRRAEAKQRVESKRKASPRSQRRARTGSTDEKRGSSAVDWHAEALAEKQKRIEAETKWGEEREARLRAEDNTRSQQESGADRIRVTCPECGVSLSLRLPLAGRIFHCSQCRCSFRARLDVDVVPSENDLLSEHQLLGTTPQSSNDEVGRCYKEQILKYHPDRVEHLGDEFKEIAHQKTRRLNEAYSRIASRRGI